ncbi:carotenoid biosynthesis protein [Heliorestis acidaminivorans]|uniref:carotenoid biosynthesis protein n=1 Tax=Heliorestis acidaminivorans TaxID=553427 RepID=UPI001478318A|nr:carotenoid biosynthesis protein [Heliorestis acidaminivorans]
MFFVGSVPTILHFSNGLFNIFFALYALALYKQIEEVPALLWLKAAFIALTTFALEWFGTKTGLLFGDYTYTPLLGLAWGTVPLSVAFAWVGVVVCAVLISRASTLFSRALEVGFWALAFDLVLDPVAYARGFWTWHDPGFFYGVPLQNFLAWFLIAMVLSFIFPLKKINNEIRLKALRLYQMVVLMFGLLALREEMLPLFLLALFIMALAEGRARFDRVFQKSMV